jgi:hypothetical protein
VDRFCTKGLSLTWHCELLADCFGWLVLPMFGKLDASATVCTEGFQSSFSPGEAMG